MTPTDPLRADQLEAWVLAGYQRLERLVVPAFGVDKTVMRRQQCVVEPADVRLLPLIGLPREVCSLDDYLADQRQGMPELDVLTRLSLFFKYLAAPLRYEPLSESAVHKAVPSSRGRFPLTYFFVQAYGASTRVYAYVPQFHGLRELPRCTVSDLEEGTAALVCVAGAWRYAEEYGEFAHVPCVLEAGHAQAQAHHLAQLLGLGALADPDRELGRALRALPLEIPLYCIGLRLQLDIEKLVLSRPNLAVPRPYPQMESRFPRLHLFQRCFDSGASPVRCVPPAAATGKHPHGPGARGMLGLMRSRSSGNDRGLASSVVAPVPRGTLASLVATWNALRRRRPASAVERELGLSLVWLGAEAGTRAAMYDIDGQSMTLGSWRGELHEALAKMLPYANTKYNFSALTAVLIIDADVLATIEQVGDAALREIYLAAGAAAQDFSLAATAHDMFARPMKMMREARMECEFKLRGQAVYLVLCGFARSANPTMELA